MKKFRLTLIAWTMVMLPAFLAEAADGVMPHIHRVGVIPVQWNGVEFGYSPIQEQIEKGFPEATRNSARFRVLNDDLVASLWNTAEGRRELKDEFELDSFVSLTMVPQGDVVIFELRLLSPELDTYILESQRHRKLDLENAAPDTIKSHLEELLFRTFNRLPVDVTVTSVQGAYITLTGGQSQGLHNGDTINIVRPSVNTVHPANGTWLTFTKKPMGSAEILDAKSTTAVARILSQVYDNAIRIGDGAKVKDITGRARFVQRSNQPQFQDGGSQETVVVPPLFQDGRPAPQINAEQPDEPLAAQQPKAPGPPKPQMTPESPEDQDQDVAQAPRKQEPQASPRGSLDPTGDDAGDIQLVDKLKIYIGAHQWSISGPTNANGNFPVWLLNTIGFGADQRLLQNVKVGFNGGGSFGGTKNGVFLAYHAEARIFWESAINIGDPTLNLFRGGGFANLQGMNVTEERYGGGDGLRGGGFAGLGGDLVVGGDFYRWYSELAINPLHIGRIGYDGTQKNVESTFGWDFTIGAMRFKPDSPVDYGASIVYGEERMTLEQGDRPQTSTFKLLANIRYQFGKD